MITIIRFKNLCSQKRTRKLNKFRYNNLILQMYFKGRKPPQNQIKLKIFSVILRKEVFREVVLTYALSAILPLNKTYIQVSGILPLRHIANLPLFKMINQATHQSSKCKDPARSQQVVIKVLGSREEKARWDGAQSRGGNGQEQRQVTLRGVSLHSRCSFELSTRSSFL